MQEVNNILIHNFFYLQWYVRCTYTT